MARASITDPPLGACNDPDTGVAAARANRHPGYTDTQVLGTFGPIALFLVVAVVFPVIPLFLSRFLSPRRPNPVKLEPYESGMETIGPTHVQFPIRYYLYALIFVIFDVEVIYLFPWALVYDKLPVVAAAEMAVFIILLLVGLAYAWRKRAFEWQ
ncbi:MAG: NADH-quinone oxidoreductase subunit A [Chloroflexi bacterium]|nr:NADH-quinone oxidoreductase subunit A [Chloroflexota bacterium]